MNPKNLKNQRLNRTNLIFNHHKKIRLIYLAYCVGFRTFARKS